MYSFICTCIHTNHTTQSVRHGKHSLPTARTSAVDRCKAAISPLSSARACSQARFSSCVRDPRHQEMTHRATTP